MRSRELLGRHADREREQPEAQLAGEHVARRAARRDPERRVRLLERLGVHAPRRDLPVLAVPLEHVLGPRAHDHAQRLFPLGAGRSGSTPKPSSSARVDERPVPNSSRPSEMRSTTAAPSAARIGWLYGSGKQAHAVTDAHALRPLRDRAVQARARSSGSTRRGSGARRSRSCRTRPAPRGRPARSCSCRRSARCPRPTASAPGSRRTARTPWPYRGSSRVGRPESMT